MTANELRKSFLDFFGSKGHRIVESDTLVPKEDPTVLFTSAGMNQFKKHFLGLVTDFKRAASCQKCLRTDDLERVGKTAFHHTFFEMLGNFSFGDYFKEEAISWAWEFLTQILKISQDQLWVSVYVEDREAYRIWKDKIGVPTAKIIRLGDKENFWPSEAKTKGPNGPCGPCSEIFFDYGEDIGCKKPDCSPACSCGRFSEVWNLVFTQFNRNDDGQLEPLPSKNIDTGMGLERLTAVMQGVMNNFDTDLFNPILDSIITELRVLNGKVSAEWRLTSGRALSDHIRAVVFAISDGVLPSNEERGYVVRKLIRRSIMLAREAGAQRPFLYKLVASVAGVMRQPYPELLQRREDIAQIIKREEESFEKVLREEIPELKEKILAAKERFKEVGSLAEELGRIAFGAYDTSGVPLTVTETLAAELRLPSPSIATFNELMEQQKNRSRQASAMSGEVFCAGALRLELPPTEFLGYQTLECGAKILKIIPGRPPAEVLLVLDRTPFYAEAGGQVGDSGMIVKPGAKMEVVDTRRIEKVFIHSCRILDGDFKVNDEVRAVVDKARRLSIARNHTATHLLQAALRKVLGEHVQQQGSLVSEDKLRFDFTHFKDIAKEQLFRIEELVNEYILNNDALTVKEMTLAQARQTGALAFFAEKYDEMVKVVSVADYSAELCAGTHLAATGQIGVFKLTGESAIAQGIRRVEAVTGLAAYQRMRKKEEALEIISQDLKVEEDKIPAQLMKMHAKIKDLNKKLTDAKLIVLKNSLADLLAKAKTVAAAKVVVEKFSDADFDFLRLAADLFRANLKSGAIILGSIFEDKALLVVSITDDLTKKGWDAGKIIKEIAKVVGGTGGGRPQMAQAGGSQTLRLDEALSKATEIISNLYGHSNPE
ncbi:MAG: alanine--tRNA ligase [Candidatus Omnitrophota bacterium]